MTQDPDLERRVDRALKRLPSPVAPPAFAAGVMRRIAAQERPAVAAAPFEWPVAAKIAFTGLGFAFVMGALWLWPLALDLARTSWQSPAVVLLRAAADTLRPMIPAALVYVTAMCAVCAAAASMLKHVALGGATNS